eukprot:60470-Amphidinium_carterae.2
MCGVKECRKLRSWRTSAPLDAVWGFSLPIAFADRLSDTVGGRSDIVAPNSFQCAGGSSCVPYLAWNEIQFSQDL